LKRKLFSRVGTTLVFSLPIVLLVTGAAQSVDPTVRVAEHSELGEILVDGEGYSLYVFTRDEDGRSTCVDQCADSWPPILIDGQVGFGEAVDLGLLGTTERDGEAAQLTFAGQPLYRFAEDEEPGDVNGHGVDEAWFLVRPGGEAVKAVEQSTSENQAAEDEAGENEADALALLMQEGATVFSSNCAQCHGRDGTATAGGAATLAGNRNLRNGPRVARQVLFGSQYMPSFGERLSDREVAAVMTHIRNSWGNDFGIFSEEEVTVEREKFQ
jgi:predicted lipoprotein with Yx(FWY)xxD motif/cytochrome c5